MATHDAVLTATRYLLPHLLLMCHHQLQFLAGWRLPTSSVNHQVFQLFCLKAFSKASVSLLCIHVAGSVPQKAFSTKEWGTSDPTSPPLPQPRSAILQRGILQRVPSRTEPQLPTVVASWILAFPSSLLFFAFLFWPPRVIPQMSYCTRVFDPVFTFGGTQTKTVLLLVKEE